MSFPVTIKYRDTKAKIYGKSPDYPYYRVAYRTGGKRVIKHFPTYSDAKEAAEKAVREISKGSNSLALSNKEAANALAIREKLESFKRDTGRTVNALEAVSGYLELLKVLPPAISPEQAVREFSTTLATVTKKPLAEAVEDYIAGRLAKTVAKDGKRPELSPLYVSNTSSWLREFSKALPGHLVSDINKNHFKVYLDALKDHSPKARNDRRAILKSFLGWCAKQDYLSHTHRLFESVGLEREKVAETVTAVYSPEELGTLLKKSKGELRAAIATQALAGLRRDEMLRLSWAEVFSREGHIEVTSAKSKTGSRRLVVMVPALAELLAPFKGRTGLVWTQTRGKYVYAMGRLFESLPFKPQDNGLRHSFCSYHFALHSNENLTSAQAGNSPAMIHKHYKGLATKAEAEEWFNVAPEHNRD